MSSREEYLAPGFDPTTLNRAQLRGILIEHGVGNMSASAKKDDLVKQFEVHVKPLAEALRAKSAKVKPSAKGIKIISDMDNAPESDTKTGKRTRGTSRNPGKQAVVEVETVALAIEPPAKRSRKAREKSAATVDSVAPSERSTRRKTIVKVEEDEVPTRTPRSRKITSETPPVPSIPSSSRRRSTKPAPVNQEGEISDVIVAEDSDEERRTKPKLKAINQPQSVKKRASMAPRVATPDQSEKSEDEVVKPTPKPKTPRRSQGEDSGFSDYNPFQSGGEEAAERERRRRKSSIGIARTEPRPRPRQSMPAPSTSTPSILRKVAPSREDLKTPPKDVQEALRTERLNAAEEYNRVVQTKLNQISSTNVEPEWTVAVQKEEPSLVRRVKIVPTSTSVPLSILFLLILPLLANFKSQSASIGYCDPASTTNDLIISRQIAQDSATSCVARRTDQRLDPNVPVTQIVTCDTSALPLLPFIPRPESCTPCPPHAVCADGAIKACESEYLISTNPLSFLSPIVDGLPCVGPRAFPPTCRPDTYKKRMIGGLAKELERDLAIGKGAVECAGIGKEDGRQGDGERFGVQEVILKDRYMERRDLKFSVEQFSDIFEAALKDLIEHGDVVESIDVHGNSWYAAVRSEMPWTCQARLHLNQQVSRWRSELSGTMAVIALLAWLQSAFKGKRQERYKVEELVQVALRRLQDQKERLHFIDPATTSNPYIAPDQLRDLVMPPTSSTSSRTKLWKKVADIVERNSNVSAREREVGGEIWKTWEWTGVGERRVTWE